MTEGTQNNTEATNQNTEAKKNNAAADSEKQEASAVSIEVLGQEQQAYNSLTTAQQEMAVTVTNGVLAMQESVQRALESQMDLLEEFDGGTELSTQQQLANMQSQVDGGINSTHLFGTLRKGTGENEYPYHQEDILIGSSYGELVYPLVQFQAARDSNRVAGRNKKSDSDRYLVEGVDENGSYQIEAEEHEQWT